MKILTGFLVIFIFSVHILSGQTIQLNGKAEAYKGETVVLYAKRDFVSGKLEKINSTIASESDGSFNFSVDADSVGEYMLKSQGVTGGLYLQPNKTYEVIFPDLPPNESKTINGTHTVAILFPNLDTTDINYLLSDFNLRYENQFYRNFRIIQSKIFLAIIDSFKADVKERYANVNNYFFKTYMNYAIGSAELLKYDAGGGRRKLDIFNEYLRNKPILYSNQEYVRFVNSFFRDYVFSFNHTPMADKIFYAINDARSPKMLMDIYKTDDFLKDRELREFIVLHSVFDVFGKKGYKNEAVLTILDSIAQKSIYKNNALIARNLIEELTHLGIGYPAPDFTFMDKKDELNSLSDLKGKYVYLNFWASWCKDCITEMRILEGLYKKYKKDIEIISICIDKDPAQMNYVLEKNKDFKWTFIHSPVFSGLFEAYDVRAVPSYFLIDDEGNIAQNPALAPSPNGSERTIEETFFNIQKKLHPKRGWRIRN